MKQLSYKIFRRTSPTFDGSNDQYNVDMPAKAKFSPSNPYEVANELLALRLGTLLGLPIPLGCSVGCDNKLYYVSLNAARGESLEKATDGDIQLILAKEKLACGIIVFDSWILNEDRWQRNISYDDETDTVCIFDHGRALYTGQRPEMEKNRNRIAIGNHCLKGIKSLHWFDYWHSKILAIPNDYLKESVASVVTAGLPEPEVEFVTQFLEDRRLRLREIFREGRNLVFTALDEGLFDPFSGEFGDYRI